ncbi:TonB-dependent receptor [Solitalea sp. MAHUQ-68]|uniref:TonB-dependent receptor n=1 Tax=Solitalea agri TaxID=2953739 RepID=A0A9X2JEX4_9SPHI|nr:TonB-dependent receptor [Solitalea agri]MCO4294385.1 TonB-dependent receptor [Solitalea agri]
MKKTLPLRLCYALMLAPALGSAMASPNVNHYLITKISKADVTVTGTITDDTGMPLPGVTVTIKGTTKGSTTDVDGVYSIVTPADATLVFQFIGFVKQEVTLNGKITKVNITLKPESKVLNEVVVIGYGTKAKKDLTGSIASVNQKDFLKGPIASPEQLLTGKVAGVQIVSNGGAPGAGANILIRGGSSLNASNYPLIVIDGVQMDNGSLAGSQNPLSRIDPKDIESFSILKDASSAAIYGSRATNGVVIITTKKGVDDKLKVNFTTSNGVQQIIKKVDVLSADQFRAYVNANGTQAQKDMMGNASTDWQNEIYQKAFTTDNSLSLTGGIKKLPYRASVGYLNQDGIVRTDNMKRVATALSLTPKFFKNSLSVEANGRFSNIKNSFSNGGAIGSAISFDPTQTIYGNDSKYDKYGGYYQWLDNKGDWNNQTTANPVALLNQNSNHSTVNQFLGNLRLDYKFPFLPALKANLNVGYDYSKGEGQTIADADAAPQYYNRYQNAKYSQERINKSFDFFFNYNKDIKSIESSLDATAGYTYQDVLSNQGNYATYTTDGSEQTLAATPYPNKQQNTMVSFFGRLNYTLKDKYLLQASMRADGSSRFSPEKRWGYFPSISGAWKVNLEDFMKDSKTISDFKLRAGWGVTGQQDGIANYGYIPVYGLSTSTAQYQFGDTFYQMYRPVAYDANLKWEETKAFNIGMDLGFANNRITATIDAYNKNTSDLLSIIPVPAGANFSNMLLTNVGSLNNKGIELTVNTIPVSKKDLTWNIGFNVGFNKNEITKLSLVEDPTSPGVLTGGITGGTGSSVQIYSVGHPVGSYYMYQQVYDAAGKPIEGAYVDRNKDGILNNQDLYQYKSSNPDVTFGANTSLNYKKWTASMSFHGSLGNYVYNNVYSNRGVNTTLLNPLNFLANASTNLLTTGFNGTQFNSDYYLQNASFFRMDNFNLGYNFGKINKAISNLSLTANVQNVFTITKYTGLDPEISNGIDYNFYPRPRTFTLGVGVDF